jgi:hypothetical protein
MRISRFRELLLVDFSYRLPERATKRCIQTAAERLGFDMT